MGASLSWDQCASIEKDKQVKACCHIEGETPVEIRINHPPGGLGAVRMPGYTPRGWDKGPGGPDRELVQPIRPAAPFSYHDDRRGNGGAGLRATIGSPVASSPSIMGCRSVDQDEACTPKALFTGDADTYHTGPPAPRPAAGRTARPQVRPLWSPGSQATLASPEKAPFFPEVVRIRTPGRRGGEGSSQRNSEALTSEQPKTWSWQSPASAATTLEGGSGPSGIEEETSRPEVAPEPMAEPPPSSLNHHSHHGNR